jgi:hypothetical protein
MCCSSARNVFLHKAQDGRRARLISSAPKVRTYTSHHIGRRRPGGLLVALRKTGHNEQDFAIGCGHFARDSGVDDPRRGATGDNKEGARAGPEPPAGTARATSAGIGRTSDAAGLPPAGTRTAWRRTRSPCDSCARECGYSFRGPGGVRREIATFSPREREIWFGGRWHHERGSAGSAIGGRSMAAGICMTGRSRARPPLCPNWSSWTMASAQVLPLLRWGHPSPQWWDRHQQSLWHRHRLSSCVRHRRRSCASARFARGERCDIVCT